MEWFIGYMVANWLAGLGVFIHSRYTDPVKTQALWEDYEYDLREYGTLGKIGAYTYGFIWVGLMTIPSLILKTTK